MVAGAHGASLIFALNIPAINLQSHNHQFACDIQTIYENAIFRLGFLSAVTEHGVAFPA